LVFHNGFTGKKYLILLNTPGKKEPYLFVKTTSQKKDKPSTTGCTKERKNTLIKPHIHKRLSSMRVKRRQL
jgi:hypothetical protein